MATENASSSPQVAESMPCGCIRGQYLCPEAERLWAETDRTFRVGRTLGKWDLYDQAAERYRAHYGERAEGDPATCLLCDAPVEAGELCARCDFEELVPREGHVR